MVFWITALLAGFYGFLGRFSPGLMWLRVEETVVGTVLGAAVAALVLPSGTRCGLRRCAADVLRAAADVLDAVAHPEVREDGEPRRTALRLRQKAGVLRAASGP